MSDAEKIIYKFKPTKDITVQELAEIMATVGLFIHDAKAYESFPSNTKKHWRALDRDEDKL